MEGLRYLQTELSACVDHQVGNIFMTKKHLGNKLSLRAHQLMTLLCAE